jgi:class 3 adenylate cyclase/tetratricopeptide (TPR) repeat protein
MQCPRCQHNNPQGARFCEECASPLARACSNCGTPLSATAKFCHGCAHPVAVGGGTLSRSPDSYTPKYLAERILTSKSALEGERKQITVLFADLKGSMELLADRDPEEARRLLDPVLERMMEAVHHYEGTVNQVMGDGIMALFGAPIGHEDHAIRACYAALRMQRRVALFADEIQRGGGTPVQIRVGLNSGEVVVRAISSDLHMDYTAIGQTTHLAARMEQMAKPGSALVTGDTLKLAEGFVQVKPLGAVPVKGLDIPVPVYELTGIVPARSRLQARAGRGLTRFVGRDGELKQLAQALERAAAGYGQAVAIVGEAGVGKSRLVWEFTRSHHTHGWLVLDSGSVSYGKATPYLPVIELLKAYCRIQERDDARAIRERVAGKLLMLDRTLEPLLTPLLTLLDVPVTDPAWDALDPAQRRQRTLDAVKRVILRESQVQPLLVIFEDLHWIDTETQALLDNLMESLPTARVLLLVNYRPEYRHAWGGKTYYLQLRIDPLPPERADELLTALLGEDRTLVPLKGALIARTEGNPFFIEESVHTLVETQVLVGERGAYRMAKAPDSWQIPATAQAILASRMDRLTPEDKRLLQTAAVIGKDVPFGLLRAIADTPEDSLRRGLAQLQTAEFLYEMSLFPDLEFTFKHALTHQVAYDTLVEERRRQLHAKIVTAMEQLYSDRLVEHTERLAYHTVRAGLAEKAIQYLREAGFKALERSAHRESIELLKQALTLLDTLPETPETLAEALSVRMALGPALMATQGNVSTEVEATYLQALELCDRLEDTTRRFPVLWGLWYVNHGRGNYERALELAEHGLRVAGSASEPAYQLEAHHSMWSTLHGIGRSCAAVEHCLRGVALYNSRERTPWWLYGTHDPGVCCRGILSLATWLLGAPDDAVRWLGEALRLARELQHPATLMIALYQGAQVYYHRGESTLAADVAEKALRLGHDHGFSLWPERAAVILGCLLVDQGQVDGGLIQAEDAVRQVAALGSTGWHDDLSITLLAGAYGIAGQPEKGLRALERLVARGSVGFYQPEVHRVHGELLLAASTAAAAEAETSFRRGLELARARQERSLELRISMSLARLFHRNGKRADALAVLAPVYAAFTQGEATRDLGQARELLDQLC